MQPQARKAMKYGEYCQIMGVSPYSGYPGTLPDTRHRDGEGVFIYKSVFVLHRNNNLLTCYA
jgi:hypothetical protein